MGGGEAVRLMIRLMIRLMVVAGLKSQKSFFWWFCWLFQGQIHIAKASYAQRLFVVGMSRCGSFWFSAKCNFFSVDFDRFWPQPSSSPNDPSFSPPSPFSLHTQPPANNTTFDLNRTRLYSTSSHAISPQIRVQSWYCRIPTIFSTSSQPPNLH